MAAPTITMLQLKVRRGLAEGRINDIPVVRLRAEEDDTVVANFPIHEYLIGGENTLKLYAAPHDPLDFAGFEARARVATFEHGEYMRFDAGLGYSDIAWSVDTAGRPVGQLFDFESRHRWMWERAPEQELNEAARERLDGFMARMIDAFARRDPEPMLQALEPAFTERALAYRPPQQVASLDDFAERLRSMPAEGWRVPDFVPSRGNYRLVCKRRLIDCVTPASEPLLANLAAPGADPPAPPWPFPMKVAFRDGDVVVVR